MGRGSGRLLRMVPFAGDCGRLSSFVVFVGAVLQAGGRLFEPGTAHRREPTSEAGLRESRGVRDRHGTVSWPLRGVCPTQLCRRQERCARATSEGARCRRRQNTSACWPTTAKRG